jgi:hypothetical protein
MKIFKKKRLYKEKCQFMPSQSRPSYISKKLNISISNQKVLKFLS